MEQELNRPRKGGLGYPTSQRAEMIENYELGLPIRASKASISRWKKNLHAKKRQKGQRNQLKGEYLELLKLYRLAHPKANLSEISNFILQHSSKPRIFHPSTISKVETELNITRKRGTTIAREQFREDIVLRRETFFNEAPSLTLMNLVGVFKERIEIMEKHIEVSELSIKEIIHEVLTGTSFLLYVEMEFSSMVRYHPKIQTLQSFITTSMIYFLNYPRIVISISYGITYQCIIILISRT